MIKYKIAAVVAALTAGLSTFTGTAIAETGHAVPWQLGFQDMASPVGIEGVAFHDGLLILITVISVFVLALLIYVMVKFNAKANPVPSKTTHNAVLEFAWTLVPILILVVVAIFSFRLLYHQNEIPETELTIKTTGHQWSWTITYPDEKLEFDVNMLEKDELKKGQLRLLAVDNTIVLPVNTKIKVLVTSDDVIHAFAMPSLYVKVDAVPGRINETWFEALRTGDFFGQCSELCGVRHGFMPLHIKIVSKEDYQTWLVKAKKEFATDKGGRDAAKIKLATKSIAK
jgi:cytochrome c oxidase subunit 2